jgi:acetyl-CoA acetyltransferase
MKGKIEKALSEYWKSTDSKINMKDVVIVSACRIAIGAFGGTLRDSSAASIGSVTIKEAVNFAAQNIACERELALDREITNINGSGIGLGHPVGATGARIIVTLLHVLKNRRKQLRLATLCGGGVAMACAIEMI